MFKKLVMLPLVVSVLALAGCETTNQSAIESAISEAKADAKAAMDKANSASGTADVANKTAQRAEAMTEQNRSALRALNDKIDRMFKTISRK